MPLFEYLVEQQGLGGNYLELRHNGTNAEIKTDTGDIMFNPNSNVVRPLSDNAVDLGSSGQRWAEVFAANGTINTSDGRMKKNITPIHDGLDFILGLKPVSYQWIDGKNSGEFNGFIAQEVEALLGDRNKALIHYDKESDRYGLRYTEFIAPIVSSVQSLYGQCQATKIDLQKMKDLMQQNKRDIASIKEENNILNQKVTELESENNKKTQEIKDLKKRLEAIEKLLMKK